nr:uncharacterized protein LOC113724717 [Coffea arabica]
MISDDFNLGPQEKACKLLLAASSSQVDVFWLLTLWKETKGQLNGLNSGYSFCSCCCSLFLSSVIFFPLFSFSSFHNNVALSLIRVLSKLVQSFVAVWYSVLPIPLSSYRPRSYSLRSWLHRSRSCAVRSLFLLLHHELSPSFFPVNSDLFCVVFAVGCWFRILCRSPEFSSFSFVTDMHVRDKILVLFDSWQVALEENIPSITGGMRT